MDLIRVRNVEKKYKNGVTAIYDLNLAIEKGSFVFVIGGSGSGKSTLIKMFYREEKPTKGQIIVGGPDVAKIKNKKVYKLRRKLGIVFQDYRLLPKLTVYENVAFALEVIGAKKDEIRVKVLKALEDVGLKNKVHNYPDMKVLEAINKNRGTTIIMATHDRDIVNKMKKQVITLKDGHLVNFKQKGTYNNEAV